MFTAKTFEQFQREAEQQIRESQRAMARAKAQKPGRFQRKSRGGSSAAGGPRTSLPSLPSLSSNPTLASYQGVTKGLRGRDKALAQRGWFEGYNSVEGGHESEVFHNAFLAGRAAKFAEIEKSLRGEGSAGSGSPEKKGSSSGGRGMNAAPTPGSSGWELIQDHFDVPHSGNDGGPFCQFGQVWFNHSDSKFYLGLRFLTGRRYLYPRESYSSAQEVIASMWQYPSASWATNPRSRFFDVRFGRGNYRPV